MDISSTSLSSLYSGNQYAGSSTASQISVSADTQSVVSTNPSNTENNPDDRPKENSNSSEKNTTKDQTQTSNAKNRQDAVTKNLSEDEFKQVQVLKQRDLEVKNHEAAHLAAAGKYATGGASFEYKRGPDGKNYAVGGEVGIDTSPIPNDPQATIQKARQIKSAAQAPATPSATDRQVAASAGQMEVQARQDMAQLNLEKKAEESNQDKPTAISEVENDGEANNTTQTKNNDEATSLYKAVDKNRGDAIETVSLVDLVA